MLKALSTICLLACFLSACVTQPYQDSSLARDLNKVNMRIAELEDGLPKQVAKRCAAIALEVSEKETKRRKADERKRIDKACKARDANTIVSSRNRSKKSVNSYTLNGKLLLGAVETVKLVKEDRVFEARIDTGAVGSSIGVFNQRNFERDGKRWVKFSLDDKSRSKVYEYPLYGTVKIKQTGTLVEERIEIKIDIAIGGQEYKNQVFNIADRSNLNYQLLIGRNFLRDIAVVDVAGKNLLGEI